MPTCHVSPNMHGHVSATGQPRGGKEGDRFDAHLCSPCFECGMVLGELRSIGTDRAHVPREHVGQCAGGMRVGQKGLQPGQDTRIEPMVPWTTIRETRSEDTSRRCACAQHVESTVVHVDEAAECQVGVVRACRVCEALELHLAVWLVPHVEIKRTTGLACCAPGRGSEHRKSSSGNSRQVSTQQVLCKSRRVNTAALGQQRSRLSPSPWVERCCVGIPASAATAAIVASHFAKVPSVGPPGIEQLCGCEWKERHSQS